MKTKLFIASVLLILLAVLAFVLLNKKNTASTEDETWYRLPPTSQTKKDYGGHGKPLPTSEQTTPEAKNKKASTKTRPTKVSASDSESNKKFQEELEKLLAKPDFDWDEFDKLLREWMVINPVAAAGWAIKLSLAEEDKNTTLAVVAEEWARRDTIAASEWAIKLSDGKDRDVALCKVASGWRHKDSIAGKKWVEGANLPDDKKKELLKIINDKDTEK